MSLFYHLQNKSNENNNSNIKRYTADNNIFVNHYNNISPKLTT